MDTSSLKLPDGLNSSVVNKTFSFTVGNWDIAPTYWQAAAIVFLLFALVWTLARLRHMYVNWSVSKASLAFFVWGFLMAVIVEGFMLIGGRTMFTELMGWENAPKPISVFIDEGRSKLVKVLGTQSEIPMSTAKESPTSESVILDYQSLPQSQADEVYQFICKP